MRKKRKPKKTFIVELIEKRRVLVLAKSYLRRDAFDVAMKKAEKGQFIKTDAPRFHVVGIIEKKDNQEQSEVIEEIEKAEEEENES